MIGLVHLVDAAVEGGVVDVVAGREELVPRFADRGGPREVREPAAVERGDIGGEVARQEVRLGEEHGDVGVAQEVLELGNR